MGSSDRPPPTPASELSDFTRRTLRTWGIVAACHGVVLALIITQLVPWKTPWVNVVVLLYAALQVTAGGGLWRCARWGWRLGLWSALLGLLAGVLVITGLLTSWLYLKSVYGVFGYGASIVCLLFAAVAFELLGLLPALQLRALLRREVRSDLGPAKAARWFLFGVLLLPLVMAPPSYLPFRLEPVAAVPAAARAESITLLRAALEGAPVPAPTALGGVPLGPGPLYVTLWQRGQPAVRVSGAGADLAAAVAAAAAALQSHPALRGRDLTGARFKLDRVVAARPLPVEWAPVVALSVVPGAVGLRRRGAPDAEVLLPDDMVRHDRFGSAPLLPRLREVRLGLDAAWALGRLGSSAGRLERIAVESWVESGTDALAVSGGNTPLSPAGPRGYLQAALQGGQFLLRQLGRDGRFAYRYRALDGRPSGTSDRSLARHVGAVYVLAQLHHYTEQPRFARGATRAAKWVIEQRQRRCGSHVCIGDRDRVKLGASALTLISLLEYQRSVSSERFADTARQLAAFLLSMQRDDGEFYHRFSLTSGEIDRSYRTMFASEQAALALVMAHEVLGDEAYLQAARRALDYLTGPKYDYFLGWFSYGADHWTCIAAEEAWPRLKSPRYLEFCRGYAAFMGRLQFGAEPAAYAGHYGFSGIMVPQAPATAGFTEAIISTYELSRHHGQEDPRLRAQLTRALEALRRDQLRPANSYLARDPAAAEGAIRRSLVQQEVRIDFVQHAVSALIRGAHL